MFTTMLLVWVLVSLFLASTTKDLYNENNIVSITWLRGLYCIVNIMIYPILFVYCYSILLYRKYNVYMELNSCRRYFKKFKKANLVYKKELYTNAYNILKYTKREKLLKKMQLWYIKHNLEIPNVSIDIDRFIISYRIAYNSRKEIIKELTLNDTIKIKQSDKDKVIEYLNKN